MQFDGKGPCFVATMIQGVFTFDPARAVEAGRNPSSFGPAKCCMVRHTRSFERCSYWVGKPAGSCLRYDSGRGYSIPESAFSGETRNQILNISEDEQGQIVAGNYLGGQGALLSMEYPNPTSYTAAGAENYITMSGPSSRTRRR